MNALIRILLNAYKIIALFSPYFSQSQIDKSVKTETTIKREKKRQQQKWPKNDLLLLGRFVFVNVGVAEIRTKMVSFSVCCLFMRYSCVMNGTKMREEKKNKTTSHRNPKTGNNNASHCHEYGQFVIFFRLLLLLCSNTNLDGFE